MVRHGRKQNMCLCAEGSRGRIGYSISGVPENLISFRQKRLASVHAGGLGASAVRDEMGREKTPMPDVSFLLSTTPGHFVAWLQFYTRVACGFSFPTERGRIILRAALTPHYEGPEGVMLVIQGYLKQPPHLTGSGGEYVGDFFLFWIVPLAPERVEVTIRCFKPELVDWLKELLTEIGKRWPEAREQLEGAPEPTDKTGESLPRGFPKKGSTFDWYREAYSIIVEYRKKYKQGYYDLQRDRPAPMIDDYRDALADKTGRRPSGKTVQTIIKLGDGGFLQDKYREMVKHPDR